ncbi:hypothetical protein R3P38DRAFT_1353303 [Favolaschia claudopus]|uniref:F-box domain-containing protein n=1 Tax=Favolaschia claudopus TaxID=2862362 RepID=A0AAW0DW25_9AGAR
MDILPPEVWMQIFAFSCTDGGFTGRSLSGVSRATHYLSKPVKYQSLCVVGRYRLFKLLVVLSRLPPNERRIKYLFIAGFDDTKAFDGRDMDLPVNADDILGRVLCLVAPSLVSLDIHRRTVLQQPSAFEIDFPLLTDLTLHGPYQSLHPTRRRPGAASFPSLRRLDIHHFSHRPAHFLQHIVPAVPRLARLRVPQCSFTPYEIQVALGILQPVASDSEAVFFPPSLERLLIDADSLMCRMDAFEGNERTTQFLKKYQKIAARDKRVRVMQGRREWTPVAEAQQQWLQDVACLSMLES